MTSSSRARKLRKEAKKKEAIIARLEKEIAEQVEENARLKARRAGMRRGPDGVLTDRVHAYHLHAKEMTRYKLANPDALYKKTHVHMDIFRFIVSLCVDAIASRDHPPFCSSDAGPDPEKCSMEEAVLLYLEYQNTKETMDGFGVDFAMNPKAVSRYVGFIGGVLGDVMPTPKNLLGMLGTVRTAEELEEFIPGLEARIYSGHIRTNIPSDGEQDTYYAKKGPTAYTAFIIAGKAVCIAQGDTRPEGEHGQDEIIEKVEGIAERVGARVVMYGAKASAGAAKKPSLRTHPGIEMSTSQGGKGDRIDSKYRGRMKAHRRTTGIFTGTPEDLGRVLQITSGTVNLVALSPERWLQLGKKYGPRVQST